MANLKRITTAACAAALLCGSLTGCGGGKAVIDKENPEISVMTMSYQVESAQPDSPVMQALEEYLGTKLNIQWVPSSGYGEKVTAAMGSGEYPMAMLITEKSSSVIQNSRGGTFWDLTDRYKNYPNLSQQNETVLNNISIDGKIYGIYRARTLGRNGITIRKDWLDKLGLDMPETIDDLYNVLKAFKEQDPDGNGQNDTFGIIMTTATSTFDNLAIWFGAPNKWGEDKDGNLQPAHLTDEYFEAVKFVKKLYDEKLVNQDFATYDGAKWDEQLLSGNAGVIIDVADRARRDASNIEKINPDAEIGVLGYVKKDASSEPATLPTSGYAGYYVFPKQALPSEDDLDFVLNVFDKCNDEEAVNLMNIGIKDRHYTVGADGYVTVVDDATLTKEFADLNQFATSFIPDVGYKKAYTTKTAEDVDNVYKDNEKYVVANPAEPLVSDTYSRKGPQLDSIITSANTKYIVGQIDEAGYKAELERWKQQGGDDYIKEINEAYAALKK